MLDWFASVAVASRSERRVELVLTRATAWAGWAVLTLALLLAPLAWSVAHALLLGPGALAVFGLALATVRRRMIFDSDDGLLRVEHRILGVRSRLAVPLFHLRRVVVAPRDGSFVLYVERRTGGRIPIDEGGRFDRLMELARTICAATELRLVSDEPRHSKVR